MSDAGCCLHSAVQWSLGGHAVQSVQSAFGCVGLHAYALVSPIRGTLWMLLDSARSLMCVVPKRCMKMICFKMVGVFTDFVGCPGVSKDKIVGFRVRRRVQKTRNHRNEEFGFLP